MLASVASYHKGLALTQIINQKSNLLKFFTWLNNLKCIDEIFLNWIHQFFRPLALAAPLNPSSFSSYATDFMFQVSNNFTINTNKGYIMLAKLKTIPEQWNGFKIDQTSCNVYKIYSFDENSTNKIGIMNNYLSSWCYKLNRYKLTNGLCEEQHWNGRPPCHGSEKFKKMLGICNTHSLASKRCLGWRQWGTAASVSVLTPSRCSLWTSTQDANELHLRGKIPDQHIALAGKLSLPCNKQNLCSQTSTQYEQTFKHLSWISLAH
jgi:hypothetical protein